MKIQIQLSTLVLICLVLNTTQGFNWRAAMSESERSERYSFGNLVQSLKNAFTGVKKDMENSKPNKEEMFDFRKQLMGGYPIAFVFNLMNKFCSSALSSQAVVPKYKPDVEKMSIQLRTTCDNYQIPLLESEKVLSNPEFDVKKKVVVLASGWTTNASDTGMINTIAKAYLCRGDTNVIAVDAAHFLDTLYSWSAFNTDEVGRLVAEGLAKIAEVIPVENIHLIGHSLGAHIVGYAGRYFNEITGKTIPRITGLDPAKPCFNEGESLAGLSRGDAQFIDIIHTNPGVLGKRGEVGDLDFYAHGLGPLQPGCFDVSCSHGRAYEYYAETVYPEQENNFLARRCTSLNNLKDNKCPGKDFAMGYAVPLNLKGNYFADVNGEAPFGNNANEQLSLKYKECGVCKKPEKNSA